MESESESEVEVEVEVEQKVHKKTGETVQLLTYSDNLEDVPPLSKINKNIQNIAVFDDWTNEPVKRMTTLLDYWMMGEGSTLAPSSCVIVGISVQKRCALAHSMRFSTNYQRQESSGTSIRT